MFKVLEELVLFYLLYKIVFDLIVPAVKTTGEVKRQVNDLREKMQDQSEKFQQQQNQYSSYKTSQNKTTEEDYIDFEEVK